MHLLGKQIDSMKQAVTLATTSTDTTFTFAQCRLLHLLYSKLTHALLLNTLSRSHFKTLNC
jgi:hypothetical protein